MSPRGSPTRRRSRTGPTTTTSSRRSGSRTSPTTGRTHASSTSPIPARPGSSPTLRPGGITVPGVTGQADNGRIFKLVFDKRDPTVVESLTVFADGDAVGTDAFVPFRAPDNIDTSKKSLMVRRSFRTPRSGSTVSRRRDRGASSRASTTRAASPQASSTFPSGSAAAGSPARNRRSREGSPPAGLPSTRRSP